MEEKTAAQQIDDIIALYGGWKGALIAEVRSCILAADPQVVEEIKWKMASRPEGLPVWLHHGILCRIETFNNNAKLVFSKGAQLPDPDHLFNARLQSSTERAIEFHEGYTINKTALKTLVNEAIHLNR